ncbi:MAG: FAD-binding oxidoreductase [Cyanobacteria bacterium]|nr:FAD-binding oxidoreductase [Cyanobacteriota bacterium]MDA0865545.1 FAD-binding oxidoreductase [Cyanobacteriota bacterium]
MTGLTQQVAAILGISQVVTWEDHSTDPLGQRWPGAISPHTSLPEAIAYPETTAALAELMVCAHKEGWRVLPCGHGSKIAWGCPVQPCDLWVSTHRLNQTIDHAVGDLTLTVAAGAHFQAVQTQLAATGQFLALDPAYDRTATLGGIVATGDAGALRQRYGGVRDQLIGLSLVRYDGQLAKAGGRVVKNVAGYDLMKLMTGAYGTLGILSQLTFRTYPLAEASQTVVMVGGLEVMSDLLAAVRRSSLTPVKLDLLSAQLLQDLDLGEGLGLAAQFQTIAAGVAEQVARLQDLAQPYGVSSQRLEAAAETHFWQGIQQQMHPQPVTPADPAAEPAIVAKVGVKPMEAIALIATLTGPLPTARIRLHGSSGIGWVRVAADALSASDVATLRGHCQDHGGYFTLLEAPIALKQTADPWGLAPDVKRLMGRLKAQFDPQNRLSPGRFGAL